MNATQPTDPEMPRVPGQTEPAKNDSEDEATSMASNTSIANSSPDSAGGNLPEPAPTPVPAVESTVPVTSSKSNETLVEGVANADSDKPHAESGGKENQEPTAESSTVETASASVSIGMKRPRPDRLETSEESRQEERDISKAADKESAPPSSQRRHISPAGSSAPASDDEY